MIEIKVHDKTTEVNIQGEKLVCLTEAVMLMAELIDALAPALGNNPELAAKMLYEHGFDAYKKKKEYEEQSGKISL